MKNILISVGLVAAILACEPPTREIRRSGTSPQSGALAVTKDNAHVLVAAEDHDQLLVVDRETKAVRFQVAVGDGPAHVLELANGHAAVTNRYGASISVVDVDAGEVVRTVDVGVEPFGLVEIAPQKVAVALAGEAAVAIVDLKAGEVEKKIALDNLDPRAVALLKGGDLYVSHMATGRFSRVNIDEGTARLVDISTRNDFGPRLAAEHLRSLTLDPDSGNVLVAHTQANDSTVRAPIGDPNVDSPGGGGDCGYSGCATELGAVEPGLTEIEVETDTVLVPQQEAQAREGDAAAPAGDCFDCGGGGFFVPNPPSILNPREGRFGGLQIQNPTAVALFDDGRGQIVINLGSKNALLMRRQLKGVAADVIGSVKLGNGAMAVAVSQDGAFAYVWNQFDGSISEIELPTVATETNALTKFEADANGDAIESEVGVVPEIAADTVVLVEDALPRDASFGRKLFFDATNQQIAANGAVSCGSCHPDGRTDGRTWQFVFGPRNTPQLGGGILDTAPFHWPGDVPTVPALNDMTVLPFMGGTGLPAESFDLVAAFIDTIRPAPSIASVQDGLNEQQLRGKAIFESDEASCTTCHGGSDFTDNASYNVGTRSAFMTDIDVFQTPVLHGLSRSAPYLHDGSALTLEDVVEGVVANDLMGNGSHLTVSERADLTAYLKTL
jgi:DNA-binding beta-propeller fold protein YncE/mono/diheme cytochrome c family protein